MKAVIAPWKAPMAVPIARPQRSVMIQVQELSKPRYCGSHLAWMTPMIMATKPSSEPTERSILRVTMTSTMPVASTAISQVCTERFQRFLAVRNSRPSKTLR